MPSIDIGPRRVGDGSPCLIIAEAGVNHNGDLSLARELVEVAANAGADAVKFQTFRADALASPIAPKAAYQHQSDAPSESQLEMLRRLELPFSAFRELAALCAARGLLFMSTPFDDESADFLESLDMAVVKVPSGELTNLRFLTHIARKGRPMIVSTGMSTLDEVADAVDAVRAANNPSLALLHCVSAYPANAGDANLRAMATLRDAFHTPVGYSDHTLGIEVALASVALGAAIVEKHFTLDPRLPGPDHQASIDPTTLERLVHGIRTVEASLGDGHKQPTPAEAETAVVARRSIVAARDLPEGTRLSEQDVEIRRPGTGLSPAHLPAVLGHALRVAVAAGTPLQADMLA